MCTFPRNANTHIYIYICTYVHKTNEMTVNNICMKYQCIIHTYVLYVCTYIYVPMYFCYIHTCTLCKVYKHNKLNCMYMQLCRCTTQMAIVCMYVHTYVCMYIWYRPTTSYTCAKCMLHTLNCAWVRVSTHGHACMYSFSVQLWSRACSTGSSYAHVHFSI